MGSHIVERYPDFAVNCFTGSFSALAGAKGHGITEQSLFERGDAYLFQAGLDESGYPEYIFPVEEAGLLGRASGSSRARGRAPTTCPSPFTSTASSTVRVWCVRCGS